MIDSPTRIDYVHRYNPVSTQPMIFDIATTKDLEALEKRLTHLISQAVPPSGLRWATNQDVSEAVETIAKRMSQLDDQITALTTKVTNTSTVSASVLALCQGIPSLIAAAVAAALAAGATPTQLQAITDLGTSLDNSDSELAAAVLAGTPQAPASSKKP